MLPPLVPPCTSLLAPGYLPQQLTNMPATLQSFNGALKAVNQGSQTRLMLELKGWMPSVNSCTRLIQELNLTEWMQTGRTGCAGRTLHQKISLVMASMKFTGRGT